MGKNRRLSLGLLAGLLALLVALSGLTTTGCIARGSQPKGWSGITAADGVLFLGSMDGELVSLEAVDGSQRWATAFETSSPGGGFGCASASSAVAVYGTPVVAEEMVYIGGYNGKFYAVDAASGLSKDVYLDEVDSEPVVGGAAVAGDRVFVGCGDGNVYALNAESLAKVWEFPTGGKVWSTPVVEGETLFIGSFDKKLYALDIADGTKRWEFSTEGPVVASPLVHNGVVYIASFDRYIYAVDAASGSLKWKSEVMAGRWFWAQPVVYNDTVYAGSLDGKLYVMEAATGREAAEAIDLESPASSPPVLVDDVMVVAVEAGQLYTIDTRTNEKSLFADIRKLAAEKLEIHAPLLVHEGNIYVHAQTKDHGSLLYALDVKTKVERWSLSLGSK